MSPRHPRCLCAGVYPHTGIWINRAGELEYRSGPARRRNARPLSSTLLHTLLRGALPEIRVLSGIESPDQENGGALLLCLDNDPVLIVADAATSDENATGLLRAHLGVAAVLAGERLFLSNVWILRHKPEPWVNQQAGALTTETDGGRVIVHFRWTTATVTVSPAAIVDVREALAGGQLP
jgi:hypothetical protein